MNNISLWEILYPQKLRTNRIYKIMKITLTLVFVSIFSMFAGNIHSQNARITFTKNNAEGGNLAASKIRNLECPSYEICLIDYGCGKFNRKIHIMEQYP